MMKHWTPFSIIPEGCLTIAQCFSIGLGVQRSQRPKGTPEPPRNLIGGPSGTKPFPRNAKGAFSSSRFWR
jgi:hypothetical protein